jgi:hypothetical protein
MARATEGLRIPTLQTQAAPGGVPVAGGVEDIGAARNAGLAAAGLASRIEALSDTLTRRAQADAEEQAWQAGTTAAEAEPGVQMEGGGRVYRTAYNRAAADTGQRRLEINARAELDRLGQQHATDPDGFNAAAASWRDRVAGELPPTMAARFVQGFDVLALPSFGRIRDQQRRAVADQAVASWTEALPGRIAGIEQAASRATQDPAAARAYRLQEDQAVAELIALGPAEAFELNGRQYPADPSRSGALSLAQIATRTEQLRATGREAAVIGAWRASGGGRGWIDDFEAGSGGASPVVERIFRAENSAGDSRRNAMGSSASGPGQITDGTWAAWAPRLGLTPDQRNDPLAHRRIFAAYQADAARTIGRPLTDGEQYGAWVLGPAGLAAFLRAGPDADAKAAYRQAAGEQVAELAFRQNPRLLEPGMTVGQVMAELGRRVAARPGDAGTGTLPADESRRIVSRLRGLQAADDSTAAEGRAEARAELARWTQENLAAIGVSGQPVRPLDPALAVRAGEDPLRLLERQTAAIEAFTAQQAARNTTDPAELQRLAESFAPGTANFRADPSAAVQLLGSLRARGVTVAGAGLTERVRDLEAEAAASGRAGAVTDQEATAAGLTPERRDEINRSLALTAELSRLRQDGQATTLAGRQAAVEQFPVEGDQARENALRVRALAEAFQARDRAVADDPAGFAMATSAPLRTLAQAVVGGQVARLPELIALTRAEQLRLGVPEADLRALPKPIGQAIAANITSLPDDAQRMQRLLVLTTQIPDAEARGQVLTALKEAGVAEHLVNAARIAPRLGPAMAGRIASELGTDIRGFQLQPAQRRDIRDTVTGVWTNADSLGGLRAAQAQATGNARFLAIGQQEEAPLTHVATVRGGTDGSIGSRAVREAYGQLYGGVQVVNRPRDQVLAAVPAGTDADRLVAGLRGVLDQHLAALPPAERARVGRGVWTDAGTGRLVFYPEASPLPLAGPDGQPLGVTVQQALATPQAAAGAPRTNDEVRAAQTRALQLRGRDLAREARDFDLLRRAP